MTRSNRPMKFCTSMEAELARCESEQRDIESSCGPAWLKALGWADWEAEKELIRREQMR